MVQEENYNRLADCNTELGIDCALNDSAGQVIGRKIKLGSYSLTCKSADAKNGNAVFQAYHPSLSDIDTFTLSPTSNVNGKTKTYNLARRVTNNDGSSVYTFRITIRLDR